jgi:hypothetical protein
MGSIPRSTNALEIPTTSIDSFLASAVHSLSILAMHAQISSSSADRSHSWKECRPHACSFASFASRTSRSVSYRERRIWHSSNIWLKLIEYMALEVKACILVSQSCWAASAWAHLASYSMRALPMARSEAASPSSHTVMVPSLLSISFTRARSCSHGSFTTADVATAPGGEGLHQPTSDDQHHDNNQAQATADMEWSPTWSTTRPSRGQCPSSSNEMAVVNYGGRGPHPKDVCHGHHS